MPVKPLDPEQAIDAAVDRALTGKPILPTTFKKLPPTKNDCERLERMLGMPIEQFNQRLAHKLALISDKIAERIEEKVDADEFKPGELGFIFSVTEDKRRALDARTQVGAAQVNIQVNNYGDKSRDEIIAALMPAPVSDNKPAPKVEEDIPLDLKPEDVI
jgi:hypothetical protein